MREFVGIDQLAIFQLVAMLLENPADFRADIAVLAVSADWIGVEVVQFLCNFGRCFWCFDMGRDEDGSDFAALVVPFEFAEARPGAAKATASREKAAVLLSFMIVLLSVINCLFVTVSLPIAFGMWLL